MWFFCRHVGTRRLVLSYNEFREVPPILERLVALEELHFAGWSVTSVCL
jgi:hypothetical protein